MPTSRQGLERYVERRYGRSDGGWEDGRIEKEGDDWNLEEDELEGVKELERGRYYDCAQGQECPRVLAPRRCTQRSASGQRKDVSARVRTQAQAEEATVRMRRTRDKRG